MKKDIQDIIKERILILDGAMGTLIQEYGLEENDFKLDKSHVLNLNTPFSQSVTATRSHPELPVDSVKDSFASQSKNSTHETTNQKGNNDVLCLTRPDVISDIHRRYLEAGADIITTNTFSSQRISQADYHLEDIAYAMALEGARLARRAADDYSTPDKPRFVAGSIGPTNRTCSMSPDVSNPARRDLTYDQLFCAYCEQVEALLEGGVDLLLIETIFDSLNAKCAIDAALTVRREREERGERREERGERIDFRGERRVPLMLSITISDKAGRTLSGQTLDAFLATVSSYPIFSIGLNCSFGAAQMRPFLRE